MVPGDQTILCGSHVSKNVSHQRSYSPPFFYSLSFANKSFSSSPTRLNFDLRYNSSLVYCTAILSDCGYAKILVQSRDIASL